MTKIQLNSTCYSEEDYNDPSLCFPKLQHVNYLILSFHYAHSSLQRQHLLLPESKLTPVRLRRNQEEVLKLHGVGRRPGTKLDTLALTEEDSSSIAELHFCKMDADARPGTNTEGVESSSCVWGRRFGGAAFLGGNPAVGVETWR